MDATIFNGMSEDMAAGVVAGGILGIGIGTIALIACIWYVLQVIAYWKIFGKFGEPGWKSIIPIYNTYTRYKATWNTKMFVVNLVLAALTGLETAGAGTALGSVFLIVAAVAGFALVVVKGLKDYYLARSFGKGWGFTFGLMFLGPVFMLILGFGSSEYIGNTTA